MCPVTGIYDVIASVCMNESATGTYTYLLSAVYKNGTAVSEISTFNALQSYGQAIVPDKIQCNAGDYLEACSVLQQPGHGALQQPGGHVPIRVAAHGLTDRPARSQRPSRHAVVHGLQTGTWDACAGLVRGRA